MSVLKDQIVAELDALSETQLQTILYDVRKMTGKETNGTPVRELLPFAGTLSPKEAERMMRDIDEACEQVDPDAG